MKLIKSNKNILNNRKFRFGAIATAVTVLFIAVIIVINILASVLADKYPVSIDLTKNKFYKISDQTIALLNSLDKDVEIIVLNSEDQFKAGDGTGSTYYMQANSIINQYPQHSKRVTVNYIDMVKNPSVATEYANDNVEVNDIIVKVEGRHKALSSKDIFEQEMSYQTYSYQVTASNAEQALSSAILSLTGSSQTEITFINGYDEEDSSAFKELLTNNNYNVKEVSILTSNIELSSKTVVIYGPKRDYDNEAIEKLKQFMENGKQEGKSIIYIASPQQGEIPVLNSFLGSYGITISSGTVFETSSNKLFSTNSLFYAIVDYVDMDYSQGITNKSIPIAMPVSKPLNVTQSADSSISTKTLLEFSSTSGIYPLGAGEDWQITDDKITGPIPAAAVAEKTENDVRSYVVAIGTTASVDDKILSMSALNNSTYFVNLFNTVSEKSQPIVLESKSVEQTELGITAAQSMTLTLLFVVILPVSMIVTGVVIWVRRRNR